MDELDAIILSGANKVKITVFMHKDFHIEYPLLPSKETLAKLERLNQWMEYQLNDGKLFSYNTQHYDTDRIALWAAKQLKEIGKDVELKKKVGTNQFVSVAIE